MSKTTKLKSDGYVKPRAGYGDMLLRTDGYVKPRPPRKVSDGSYTLSNPPQVMNILSTREPKRWWQIWRRK